DGDRAEELAQLTASQLVEFAEGQLWVLAQQVDADLALTAFDRGHEGHVVLGHGPQASTRLCGRSALFAQSSFTYIDRRYSPPTSNRAREICPKLHTRTVSM